jgi:hypothetical protein
MPLNHFNIIRHNSRICLKNRCDRFPDSLFRNHVSSFRFPVVWLLIWM